MCCFKWDKKSANFVASMEVLYYIATINVFINVC